MHSSLYPEPSEDGETTKLNCETTAKKVSVQAQLPSKFFNERLATPRVRCAVDVDEDRPLRCRRSSQRPRSDRYTTESEVFVSASSSGNRPKPWPSRKGAEVEELVKYMSSVPCYLQRIEKGENVQEKALNFGVIDWRRLEKWTNSQKKDQKNVISSTINLAESSSLFTNQTCSLVQRQQTSCRSSSNSPAERKRTFSLDGNSDPSDELKSRCVSHSPKSRTSTVSRSLWCSPESKHDYRTSMQTATDSLIEEERHKSCDQQSSNHDGRFPDKRMETSFLEQGFVLLDHHQRFSCEKSKTLVGMRGDRNAMEASNSLSGKLPQKFSHRSSLSSEILQSGLLSAMFESDKSHMGATAFPTKNGVTSSKFMTINEEAKQIGKSSGNYMFNTDDQSSNQKVEGISGGRKEALPKLPSASGLKWLNRSSSLKDVSSSHQLKDTNGLDISDDKGRSNSRGRRSPLRRILDPLLKFKYDGNSGPIASSPIQRSQEHRLNNSVSSGKESTSLSAMQKSSDASIVSSNTQMPITSQGLLQDQKYGVTMRHALVKLAWKKGQPLFMFSANDDSVLVASMRTNRLGKEDSGGIYTIVTAEEHKKKGGIWIGLGRSGKPNLLYDVVGRMEVSGSMLSSFDSKILEFSRQFVLVSDELLPNQGCIINSDHSSQLAAIIVKAPCKKLNGSIYNALSRDPDFENLAQDKHSSLHIESLQVEKYPEYSRACSISAILPIGIHGFSDLGKPSTLIERWKSGGSCDCEGWDEGCRLTVLADRLHEMKVASSVEECPTTDGFRGIELFVQGGKADNKYAFRMIAFKEGLYTVEFGSSITSLQAFAICIATLHSKNSIDVSDYSAKHRSLKDPLYENYPKMNSMQNNGGPTSYEPHHPPFSPVGRS